MINIFINGVGRIGKSIFRLAATNKNINIVAINDINKNQKNIAYGINYDSTYGQIEDKFSIEENFLVNSTNKIQIFNQTELTNIDFNVLNVDVIIDASGVKADIDKLKNLPVKKVILTYANKEVQNVVLGVNEEELSKNKVIAASSCNATALLPVLQKLDDNFEIEFGDVATIHPLLNHQKTLDSGCIGSDDRGVECNFEFGRSATQNIIPSKTTTIDACAIINPKFNSKLISSHSFRTNMPTVGAINLCVSVKNKITKEGLIEFFKDLEKTQQYKIFLNNTCPLVSSDFTASQYTSILDHRFTQVIQNKMVKLVLWYDNEYGYASKVVDMIALSK